MKKKIVSVKEGYKLWANTYDAGNIAITLSDLGMNDFLPQKVTGKKVLDVGCGTGRRLSILEKKGAKIFGVDVSKEMLDIAHKKAPSAALKLAPAHKLPFQDNEFDIVISNLVFEHIKDTHKSFEEIFRVLKQNGMFILSIINPESIEPRDDPNRKHFVVGETRYQIESYNKRPEDLLKQFEDVNLQLVRLNKLCVTEDLIRKGDELMRKAIGWDIVWIYKLRKK